MNLHTVKFRTVPMLERNEVVYPLEQEAWQSQFVQRIKQLATTGRVRWPNYSGGMNHLPAQQGVGRPQCLGRRTTYTQGIVGRSQYSRGMKSLYMAAIAWWFWCFWGLKLVSIIVRSRMVWSGGMKPLMTMPKSRMGQCSERWSHLPPQQREGWIHCFGGMKPLTTTAKSRMVPMFWRNKSTYHHSKEENGSYIMEDWSRLSQHWRERWS